MQLVELLLDHGADVRIAGTYAFHCAVWGGQEVLACLLEHPMTAEQRGSYLNAALQNAAHWGILDLVSWLLDQGADPKYRGGQHGFLLTAAACNPHVYNAGDINNRRLVVDLLLKRGAELNPSPLRNVATNLNRNLRAEFHPSPLAAALDRRAITLAQALLAAGADPNLGGGMFSTPLQTAARHCPSMVKPLLDAGADPHAVSPSSVFCTALQAAAYAHHGDAIKELLAAGADPNIVGGKYGTALQAAAKLETTRSGTTAWRDSLVCMKTLVKHGGDVRAQGGKYGSVVQMAAKSEASTCWSGSSKRWISAQRTL